jgi:hypothetical protein
VPVGDAAAILPDEAGEPSSDGAKP